MTTGREFPQCAGRRFELRGRQLPGSNLGLRRELRLVELLDELLEAGHPLDRRIDDDRVHLRVRSHHDLTRKLQVGSRTAPRVPRHRRLGEHLVDGAREFLRTCDPQGEDADLAAFRIETVGVVEFGHDRLDLVEKIRMRGHDERIRRRVRVDAHRSIRSLVGRTTVVGLRERRGEVGRVGGSDLEDSNRRERLVGDVEGLDDRPDDLVLTRLGRDEEGVDGSQRFDFGRRTAEDRHRQLVAQELLHHRGDLVRFGVFERQKPDVRRASLGRFELSDDLAEACERRLLADGEDRPVHRVDFDLDRTEVGIALGLFTVDPSGAIRDRRDVARRDLDDPKGTTDRHRLEIAEDLLDLLEGELVARDDQRPTSGFELHGHLDRLLSVGAGPTEDALPGERGQGLRDLAAFATPDVPGPQRRLRRQFDPVELLHQLLEARPPRGRRLDDEGVGAGIRAHEHLARLTQVRKRPPATVERHRWFRVQGVQRRRQIGRTREPQREDHRLPLGFPLAVAIQRLDELPNLLEHGRGGGDDQRVGRRIRLDPHRLFASHVGRPCVVSRVEKFGHLDRIARGELEHAERGHLRRLEHVELAHEALDRRDLRRIALDPEAVGRLHHVDRGRTHRHVVSDDDRGVEQFLKRLRDFRGPHLTDRDHSSDARLRKKLAGFGDGELEGVDRVGVAEDLERGRLSIESNLRHLQASLGRQRHPSLERRDRPFQESFPLAGSDAHHSEGDVTGLRTVERGDQLLDQRKLLHRRLDHEKVERIDRFESRWDVGPTVPRLEHGVGQTLQRTDQSTRIGGVDRELPDRRLRRHGSGRDHEQPLEGIEIRPGPFDHQTPAAVVELDLEFAADLALGLGVVHALRPIDRDAGIDRVDDEVPNLSTDPPRTIDQHQGSSHRVDVAGGTRDHQAPSIRSGDELDDRRLSRGEHRTNRLDRGVRRRVGQRQEDDAVSADRRVLAPALEVGEECGRLLDDRWFGGDGQSIRIVEHHVGGSLVLGKTGEELVELRSCIVDRQTIELDRPHGAHRTDHRRVQHRDRGAKAFDASGRAARDDRVRSHVGGETEPGGQNILFDLHRLLVLGDRAHHALAHELLEDGDEVRRRRMDELDLLDRILHVLPIELVDDLAKTTDVGRRLDDEE